MAAAVDEAQRRFAVVKVQLHTLAAVSIISAFTAAVNADLQSQKSSPLSRELFNFTRQSS
jgi:hypothetical protein